LKFQSGSEGSLVQGLVIGNFGASAINFYTDNNKVRCSHIGVGADGVTAMPNDNYAVNIQGDNNVIGGQAAHGRRNVLSANEIGGIFVNGSENIITNNFIGTTADGLNPLGNVNGIYLGGTSNANNIIGGTIPLARNVISGNSTGIYLYSGDNFIWGNLLGTGRDGTTPLPNSYGMVVGFSSSGNAIGGIAPGEPNLIAFNNYDGIMVAGSTPLDNRLRGNIYYNNGDLAIDLNDDGVDTNDIGDSDGGANGTQNYPVLNGISNSDVLAVTLNSKANTIYDIDIYRTSDCDPSGHGEGQEVVYRNTYQTGGNGQVNINLSTTFWSISPGDYLTALATDPNGNTSEFSACLLVPSPPATPTPTATNTPTVTLTPSPTPTSTMPAPPDFTEQAYIPVVRK
jgi:hypothetical protein